MPNIYFGNIRKAQYIPAPKAGMDAGGVGSDEDMSFVNGGRYLAQSAATSRTFPMAWDVTPKESLDCLVQYRNGEFGTGLLYWVDPFASNALPPHWASPELATKGWPSLIGAATQATQVAGAQITNSLTNPNSLTTSGTTELRRNAMANPTVSVNTTGYSQQTGGGTWTSSSQTTGAPTGATTPSSWYRMIATAANTISPVGINMTGTGTTAVPISENTVYTLSAYVFVSGTTIQTNPRFGWTFYDAAGAAIGGEVPGGVAAAPDGVWVRREETFTAPAGAAYIRPLLRITTAGGVFPIGAIMGITGVMVEAGSSAQAYFDGSTTNAGDFSYNWTGTAGASASTVTAPTVYGSITTPARGYSYQSSDGAYSGSKFSRSVVTNNASGNVGIGIEDFTGTLAAGTYTLTFMVRANRDGQIVVPRIRNNLGTGVVLKAGVWTKITTTQTVASGAITSTGGLLQSANNYQVGDVIDVDMHSLVRVSSLGTPYTGPAFSGDTVLADGTKASWNGTPNASSSNIASTYGALPQFGALFQVTTPANAAPSRKLTMLIPPDKTLWLGFSGSATGSAQIVVQPYMADGTLGTITVLNLLDPKGDTRLNAYFDGSKTSAVQVYIRRSTIDPSSITLVSGTAIFSAIGVTPTLTGDHISGQGHTGCRISDVGMVYVQAAKGRKLVTAATTLTEIGAWL